jgi:hypothetical protein
MGSEYGVGGISARVIGKDLILLNRPDHFSVPTFSVLQQLAEACNFYLTLIQVMFTLSACQGRDTAINDGASGKMQK